LKILFSIILILVGAYCEYQFVRVFSELAAGKSITDSIFKLVAATCAPLTYLIYYFHAFSLSIGYSNKVLRRVSKSDDFFRKDYSVTKQLTEDYILSHEQLMFPLQLMIYRLSVLSVLFYQGLAILFVEIGHYTFYIVIFLIIAVVVAKVLIQKISIKFSELQTIRSKVVDEVVSRKVSTESLELMVKRITDLNFGIYFRKLLSNFIGSLSKPIIDFIIMVGVLVFVITDFESAFSTESLVAIALIGYRSIGPFLTILNGSNQVQFGWRSLSKTWKTAIYSRRD
jgi:hypothetical protein